MKRNQEIIRLLLLSAEGEEPMPDLSVSLKINLENTPL
jgi:hypothetical protein